MQPTVAKNVNGVVMTSSPGPMFRLIRQLRIASVPLETPTPNRQSLAAAIFCSSSCTFGPPMQTCESSTSEMPARHLDP